MTRVSLNILNARQDRRLFLVLFLLGTVGNSLVASTEEHSETELAPIQVWGARRKAEPPLTEFTGETIELNDLKQTSLTKALELTPSVVPKAPGTDGEAGFLIRGQDSIQNRYFLDGVPLTDAEFNSADLSLLPLEALNRIDVFAEGTPVRLADDGLSGALDFHLDWPDKTIPVLVSAKGGSFSYARVFGRAGLITPVRGVLSAAYTRSSEDFVFFDDNGTPFNSSDDAISVRQNNGFQRVSLLPQIELIRNRTHSLRAFSLDSFSATEIPPVVPLGYSGQLNRWLTFSALQYHGELDPQWELNAHLRLRTVSDELKDTGLTPGLMPSKSDELALGGRVHAIWKGLAPAQIALVTGAGVDTFKVQVAGASSDQTTKRRYELPLGVYAIVPAGVLTLRPGILAHYYAYDLAGNSIFGSTNSDPQRHYLLASPRFGADYRMAPNVKLRGSVGHFYRAPTMYELFGAPIGVTPSQNLTYETALKGDVGVDWEYTFLRSPLRSLRASGTYFIQNSQNLITYVQNSDQSRVAVNVGAAMTHGQELAIEARSRWDLNLKLTGIFLWTENRSDISYLRGKELPGRPPYRFVSSLAYEKELWSAEYTLLWNGPTYWDLSNMKLMDSTMEHGVAVSLRTRSIGNFILEGRNLFNSITATSVLGGVSTTDNTTGYFGYPAPGRRVTLTWKYEI